MNWAMYDVFRGVFFSFVLLAGYVGGKFPVRLAPFFFFCMLLYDDDQISSFLQFVCFLFFSLTNVSCGRR